MTTVTNEKDLGKAIKSEEDTIQIEGDLARKIIRIRATGKVAWAIAFGAIGVAVAATIIALPTGGTSEVAAAAIAPAPIAILGGATTYSCIAIALAAGGIGSLAKLRTYKEVSRSEGRLVLKRR
ncbi:MULTISPECIES: hypothetical protein [Herbaspirillum]|uniref:hypothetical protein n=1 Tax=Herbaspirillum TaxID=963 RepID=UPI0005C8B1B9|nr:MULTISPECIES: hypothetical protein [Herbaspirillum]NQE47526.1 hypothetical protein [Herbaspirillum rubrisubalbicans]